MLKPKAGFVLGANLFGYTVSQQDAFRIMEKYLTSSGQLWVDTAHAYSNGLSEEIIGNFIRANGLTHNEVYVASKIDSKLFADELEFFELADRRVELSLGRLGRPAYNTLYLHNPDISKDSQALAKWFSERTGQFFLESGLSNPEKTNWSKDFIHHGQVENLQSFRNLFCQNAEDDCFSHKIKRFSYGLMGRGVLFEGKANEAKSRVRVNVRLKEISNDPNIVNARAWLKIVSEEINVSPSALLASFAFQVSSIPVIGVRNMSQLADLLSVDLNEIAWKLGAIMAQSRIPSADCSLLGKST